MPLCAAPGDAGPGDAMSHTSFLRLLLCSRQATRANSATQAAMPPTMPPIKPLRGSDCESVVLVGVDGRVAVDNVVLNVEVGAMPWSWLKVIVGLFVEDERIDCVKVVFSDEVLVEADVLARAEMCEDVFVSDPTVSIALAASESADVPETLVLYVNMNRGECCLT